MIPSSSASALPIGRMPSEPPQRHQQPSYQHQSSLVGPCPNKMSKIRPASGLGSRPRRPPKSATPSSEAKVSPSRDYIMVPSPRPFWTFSFFLTTLFALLATVYKTLSHRFITPVRCQEFSTPSHAHSSHFPLHLLPCRSPLQPTSPSIAP